MTPFLFFPTSLFRRKKTEFEFEPFKDQGAYKTFQRPQTVKETNPANWLFKNLHLAFDEGLTMKIDLWFPAEMEHV